MDISSAGSSSAAVMGMLSRNAEEDVAKTAYLMKQAIQGEKDIVSKLLPLPQTGLDIQA